MEATTITFDQETTEQKKVELIMDLAVLAGGIALAIPHIINLLPF